MDQLPATLRFYSPSRDTTARRRCLPHLEQDNVCYFVTFCARDAVPKVAREKSERAKQEWLRCRGLPTHLDPENLFEILPPGDLKKFQRFASRLYQRALDRGSGECVLRKCQCAHIVSEALKFHGQRTCLLADYVVMPNHVHALIQPHPEITLKSILASVRSYSARMINQHLGTTGSFWAHEGFDHMVRSLHHFRRYQSYIRANPSRARLRDGQYILHAWEMPP